MPNDFLRVLDERVLILDGGMGTSIHLRDPQPADWGGEKFVNLSDAVSLSRPEWILDIHRAFFAAGCDAVETNTFNASKLVLGEFGMADHVVEYNRRSVELARQAANEFSTPDRPRFVVASIGPGTKMPSLLNDSIYIHFDELYDSYQPQMVSLVEAGVDAILVETCFDILQAKCAIICAVDAMKAKGVKIPLMVQVTIQQDGRMLPGTDIAGALTTLECFDEIDVIGMNCAVGPDLMLSSVKHLSQFSKKKISVLPNAGLPENVNGTTYFPLQPDELAQWLERFVTEFGVNIVGGCCGTTPAHLKAVADRVAGKKPATRHITPTSAVSSLFGAMDLQQDPRPLLVGERTNTNGSKKFKHLLEKDDWQGLVEMAQEQEREGVHILDVCAAFVGRDEVRDMREVIKRYNAVITKPLMVDSTEWQVIDESLKLISGKAIINSINLEEGRKKLDIVVPLAKRYGAALVALTIDEVGQADTAEWKFQVAKRIYDICVNEYNVPPGDILFDPLVFPLTTGQEQTRRSAIETFEAIRRIKNELPGALTHVGLSNASFGLSPYTRQVLNSVYLHEALEFGLDSAILHASKIMPLASIDSRGQELCRRLLFDDRTDGDPLHQLIEHYSDQKSLSTRKSVSLGDTIEERLKNAIIQGRRESLMADLDLARERYSPIDIINKVLLDGMKVVGELFGSGQMQLPFVLQSAEVMKASVAYLEGFMEKIEGAEKGRIVLATVKGDVHDIGKNLVDIILSNNGYKVYNIGIKQPIENMITAYQKYNADAIGMSGLLVKSTVVMKEDLQTLNERGLMPPVILGGAALTRRYVEDDLKRLYHGQVFYGEDAFAGLRIMDQLAVQKKLDSVGSTALKGVAASARRARSATQMPATTTDASVKPTPRLDLPKRSPTLPESPDVPTPPFFGSRIITDISVEDVYQFINERTLMSTQWGFVKNNVAPKEYERQMREIAHPAFERLKQWCLDENILRPAVAYGFFPCAADGDDVVIYEVDGTSERERFTFPRQDHGDYLCLSDFYHPLKNGVAVDVVGFMAVTVGHEVSRRALHLKEVEHRYQDYLYLHGLGVECAEGLAELFHQRMRREWGIAGDDSLLIPKLFKKHYRGCRYAFGYPACPALEDQTKLFGLIEPERVGILLSEQFQLEPEQSTTALVVHHPKARYFNVSRYEPVALFDELADGI